MTEIEEALNQLQALQRQLNEMIDEFYKKLYQYRKHQGGVAFEFTRGKDEQNWRMQ